MPHIKAICISREKGTKKYKVEKAFLIAGFGIEDDAHAGEWHRQISLLSSADIDDFHKKKLPDLMPGDFAENLLISDLDLNTLGLGSILKIGNDAKIAITQIGKICHNRCKIFYQTGDCIMPKFGLFARVISSGYIQTGDNLEVIKLVPRSHFQIVVITVSDRCSRGEAVDTAGPAIIATISSALPSNIYRHKIIPDEQKIIEDTLKHYSDGHSIDLILVTGGTGFSPRDLTPEAVRTVIERLTPGIDEAMRMASLRKTPYAMLSRAVSGIRKNTLIISLPGSERAATENLSVVLPALEHGLRKLRGDPFDCGRPDMKNF